MPASVERACEAVAGAVEALDRAVLLRANSAVWNAYWPEVERLCWFGEMDVLDVSREVATALVTNSSERAQLARLEDVGLESAFDVVIISGEIGVAKPDVAIFEAALDRLGLTRREVWHVGDSLSTDVAGAVSAGIPSVWLNRSRRQVVPSDPQPDLEVISLRELPSLLIAD